MSQLIKLIQKAHSTQIEQGRTNDAFDAKGCIVSRPEDYPSRVTSHAAFCVQGKNS